MLLPYLNTWLLFTMSFGLMLIVTFVMMQQARNFCTKDVIVRKFSIMELEVPATAKELVNLIKGLYELPNEESQKSITALKGQLKVDFLYMPFAYGSIFLLCWRVAQKMHTAFGQSIFLTLAFLQLVPWLLDIIENIYLLNKINPNIKKVDVRLLEKDGLAQSKHKRYLFMEAIKWGVALIALVCSSSAVFYFWLTGNYSSASLNFLLIVIAELVLFGLAVKYLQKKDEHNSQLKKSA
jgi:hypothetical protein